MPSTALLAVAGAAAAPSRLAAAGLLNDPVPGVDLARVMAPVRQLRDHFVAGPVRASAPGEHSVAGRPRFIDANTLEVNGETLTTDATLLATGTRPILPRAWQALGDRVVTSDSFFELEHPGRRVAVVGLGPIGVEMGQGLARLGVEVHGITRGQRRAGLSDPLGSDALAARLGEELSLTLGETADLEPAPGGVRAGAGGRSPGAAGWARGRRGRGAGGGTGGGACGGGVGGGRWAAAAPRRGWARRGGAGAGLHSPGSGPPGRWARGAASRPWFPPGCRRGCPR